MQQTQNLLVPYVPTACHRPLINSKWEELKVTFLEKNVTLIYHQRAISSTPSSRTMSVGALTLLELGYLPAACTAWTPGGGLGALYPPHSKPDWTPQSKTPPLSKAGSGSCFTQQSKAPSEHCWEVQPQIPSDKACHRLRKINKCPKAAASLST